MSQIRFTLVTRTEPAAELDANHPFFVAVTRRALLALATPRPSAEDAWALCEYLDAVDSSDLPVERSTYQACTNLLAAFLCNHPNEAQHLAQRSWAALTLTEVLNEYEQSTRQARERAKMAS